MKVEMLSFAKKHTIIINKNESAIMWFGHKVHEYEEKIGGMCMRFVRTDDLKPGMRLARPIYNKSGVLLYERNTKLTMQGIYSVKNFGLIGIYILEPAEPLPPMTEDDIEFERFQTMSIFTLREALKAVAAEKKSIELGKLTRDIVRQFGNMKKKINFMQNLRSPEDDVYKHSLNVAILAALMANRLQFSNEEKEKVVMAALIHDIGKLLMAKENNKGAGKEIYIDHRNPALLKKSHLLGYNTVSNDYNLDSGVKSLVGLMVRKIDGLEQERRINNKSADILHVAYYYDNLTCMKLGEEPKSEVEAIRYLLDGDNQFSPNAVRALIDSVNILSIGVCVELTNGHKGLVLSENKINILRPMVLSFNDNQLYDLHYERVFKEIQIKDIMKTMDNRYVMDKETAEGYIEETKVQEEIPLEELLTEAISAEEVLTDNSIDSMVSGIMADLLMAEQEKKTR